MIDNSQGKSYLTRVNAQTKLSAKGQIVIPKDVRDRMGLEIGESFDVIDRGNEVVLRRTNEAGNGRKLSPQEATALIREIVKYPGPRISDEEIASAGPEMAAAKYRRFLQQQ
jgi:AbrB family looped-hinge helix DNA binding protein